MSSNHTSMDRSLNLFPYEPSHSLAIVFSVLVGMSLVIHTVQNFYYGFWRVTFFLVWAGLVFTAGWITRAVSTYQTYNLDIYIAQAILTYLGPPVYAAAEYNVLSRLMSYIPNYNA
ncbi:hypothetical protein M501DRAFT_1021074 [Patellaria atrata CBS 101060]|uniref:RTA1 domain protein n=1 Tax=Patellaria atrata CBS 101060 TaxID=1346257 RepID=A0A9P4VN38_9PEZI|nr:hypothetical protein M501DRAFT_1021074 [Patellaria atrata CBS 101060]